MSRRGHVTSLAFSLPPAVFPLESQRSLRWSRSSHLCLSLHRPGYRPMRRLPLASRLGLSSPDHGPYPEAPEESTHPQAHPKDREKVELCGLEGGYIAGSLAVMTDAAHLLPEYKIADPICTFLFSLFVLVTTFTILRDILLVLMEGAPIGIKYNAVRDRILMVKGVKAIHNMYIWALTMNQVVLSAHVVLDDTVNPQPALKEVTEACFDNFSFHSVTIQVEQQLDQNPDCAYCQDPKD
ncbi:UNVERIFIED_CONTAM: hypothetical protein FKN15_028403 [Acipenser sinensis]